MIGDADGGTWRVTEGFLFNTTDESEKARADTHAHVVLVRMVPVSPGYGVVHGAVSGNPSRRGWWPLMPVF